MKRLAIVAAVAGAASFALGAPVVGSQEAPPESTSTTEAPTTTVEAPTSTTTTTEAPVAPEDTTTTTSTTIPETVPVPEILLFGETIAAGTLDINVQFEDDHDHDCTTTVPLDGGQMNRVNDADGDLGLVYGQTATGTGTAAVFLMELGAIPVGVGILSMEDATCSLDALGLGILEKGPGRLALDGIGVGVHPYGYLSPTTTDPTTGSTPRYTRYGRYVEQFDLTANVGASAGEAQLDVESFKAFLLRPRAGLE